MSIQDTKIKRLAYIAAKGLKQRWKLIICIGLILLLLKVFKEVDEENERRLADAQKCLLPQLFPWSTDALLYETKNMSRPECINISNIRFKIVDNQLVRLREGDKFWNNSVCFYRSILHDPVRPDFKHLEKPRRFRIKNITTTLDPELEHIYVWCKPRFSSSRHRLRRKTIYEDYLSAVQLKPKLEEKLSNISGQDFYSVLIIGQDSLSHMSFRRFMPKFHEYLVSTMDAIEFNGFNSLGPGTHWSIFPLLSGLDFLEYQRECWPGQDKCPHIWRDFEARGYRTAYDEDSTDMGIFNEKEGFETNQFHYDFRPVSNLLRKRLTGHKYVYKEPYCYGSRLSSDVLMKNMCKITEKFHNEPFWSFMWAQSLSHSKNWLTGYSDQPMRDSLKYLNENQLLNKTILIILSDHGARYGDFRRFTRQGYLEERLPLLYIVLPKQFRAQFPLAALNMEQNANQLTTVFDVYEMMKDLLNLEDLAAERLAERANEASLSSRRNYRKRIPMGSAVVQRASVLALKYINDNLSNHSRCNQLQLVNVTQAFELKVQERLGVEYDRFGSSAQRDQMIEDRGHKSGNSLWDRWGLHTGEKTTPLLFLKLKEDKKTFLANGPELTIRKSSLPM
ncbi:unnamed protein product [Allacma fusca]|uniref:Uncharacterized protein n=1 Tax=Allacma fusca TaxID=39272 RepID=A0A8J2LJ17_9HEXA|nr:unnamed protein product [Allacma fusca]